MCMAKRSPSSVDIKDLIIQLQVELGKFGKSSMIKPSNLLGDLFICQMHKNFPTIILPTTHHMLCTVIHSDTVILHNCYHNLMH